MRGVSAAVLVVIGVVSLVAAIRPAAPDPRQDRAASPVRTYARFVTLTAVNPLTAVTFTAIAVGLATQVGGAASSVAFVAGVGLASLAWQLLLAVSSGLLGLRLPPVVRTWVSVVGAVVVVAAGRRARRLRPASSDGPTQVPLRVHVRPEHEGPGADAAAPSPTPSWAA